MVNINWFSYTSLLKINPISLLYQVSISHCCAPPAQGKATYGTYGNHAAQPEPFLHLHSGITFHQSSFLPKHLHQFQPDPSYLGPVQGGRAIESSHTWKLPLATDFLLCGKQKYTQKPQCIIPTSCKDFLRIWCRVAGLWVKAIRQLDPVRTPTNMLGVCPN